MMNTGVVTASLFFSFVAIYIWNYTHWTRRKIRQGIQFPLLGDNFKHFFGISAFPDVLQSIYNKFPNTRYMGFYQFLQPGLLLRDPNLIKKISMSDKESFLDRTPFLSQSSDVLWNKNLFALRGEKWREMRYTLSPAFSSSKMKQMFILIVNYAQKFTCTLNTREGNILEMEFKDLFARFTNDIIASTAFGLDVDSLNNPDNEFYIKGMETTNSKDHWKNLKLMLTLICPALGKVLKTNVFTEDISDFFRSIIQSTIDHRRSTNQPRNDMLQLLMQAHEEVPDDEEGPSQRRLELDTDDIASQALVFFLGGFDTVSSAMCFMAYELARNQDIQTQLIEEIDEYKKQNEIPKYEDIVHMRYLDMVLAETFRKWPPIMNIDRICTRRYKLPAELPSERDIFIEEGNLVWIPVWSVHHDPKHWPNPEKFDPERFSKENRPPNSNGTYIPFGLGARSCIGNRFAIMQIKVLFYELLQKFRIVTIPRSQIPFIPVKHTFNLVSQYGFWFGLQKRLDGEVIDDDKKCDGMKDDEEKGDYINGDDMNGDTNGDGMKGDNGKGDHINGDNIEGEDVKGEDINSGDDKRDVDTNNYTEDTDNENDDDKKVVHKRYNLKNEDVKKKGG